MTAAESRPARILMIEDDPDDARLTLESLKGSKLRNDVTVVPSGDAALRRLRGEGDEDPLPRPDLILLDINLPGLSGIEVLEQLKGDPDLATVPVVMLTTSGEEADILSSYRRHAAAYVQKPLSIEGFAQVVSAIEQFWFEVVLFAPGRD